jgi:Divergent InlB B-repeat domain
VVGVFNAESTPPAEFNLTITPPSNGSILCNSGAGAGNCAAKYAKGTVLTLTETPGSGFEFTGWTGDCSGTGACSVTMSAAHTVGASFKAVQSGGGGGGGNTGGGGGTNTPPPGGGTPPPGGGGGTPHKTPAQILAEKRKKAVAKCKKLSGKAEAKCLVKARQIGKPKKKKSKGKVRSSARIVGRRTW